MYEQQEPSCGVIAEQGPDIKPTDAEPIPGTALFELTDPDVSEERKRQIEFAANRSPHAAELKRTAQRAADLIAARAARDSTQPASVCHFLTAHPVTSTYQRRQRGGGRPKVRGAAKRSGQRSGDSGSDDSDSAEPSGEHSGRLCKNPECRKPLPADLGPGQKYCPEELPEHEECKKSRQAQRDRKRLDKQGRPGGYTVREGESIAPAANVPTVAARHALVAAVDSASLRASAGLPGSLDSLSAAEADLAAALGRHGCKRCGGHALDRDDDGVPYCVACARAVLGLNADGAPINRGHASEMRRNGARRSHLGATA